MTNLTSLTKDLAATARRIQKDLSLFTKLSTTDQVTLQAKFNAWSPKTAESIHLKTQAIELIAGTENFIGEPEVTPEATPEVEAVVIPTIPAAVSQSVAEKIAKETFIFEFHTSEPSFIKKIDSDEFLERSGNNGEVTPARLRVSKYLLDRSTRAGLRLNWTGFTKFLRDMALPSSLLATGGGQYLIPLTRLDALQARLEEFLAERETLVDTFIQEYPRFIEESKVELGKEFRSGDYPDASELRDKFITSFKYTGNTVPEEFEKMSKGLYEAEQARVLAICAQEGLLLQAAARESFLGHIEHLSEALLPDEETGKAKRFQKSTVDKLKEFNAAFGAINFSGDGDLSALVAKAEAILDGVDPGKLRSDDDFRTRTQESLKSIRKLVVTKTRKIELD